MAISFAGLVRAIAATSGSDPDLEFYARSTQISSAPERREEDEEASEDDDTGAQLGPSVRLEDVVLPTGEEDEDVLLDLHAKLYRFDNDGKRWKERGRGNVKLLEHKETGAVRLVMRQAGTLKICANHLVLPSIKIKMQEHVGKDKSCMWHAADFAEGELKAEMFCMRFGSVEDSKKFMEIVESISVPSCCR